MGEVYEVWWGRGIWVKTEDLNLERVPNTAGLNSINSVVVLLISTQLEGQKEKCLAHWFSLVMSRAHEHYIIFLNVNNSCVNSCANQSTGHSLILIVLEVTI